MEIYQTLSMQKICSWNFNQNIITGSSSETSKHQTSVMMLDFSNHLVHLNPSTFVQSTASSHSDLPDANQIPTLHFILFR